jgi:hypothetical protein
MQQGNTGGKYEEMNEITPEKKENGKKDKKGKKEKGKEKDTKE